MFAKLDKNKKYDIIVSNPPYVSTEAMNDLPTEYKYEPSIALWAGTTYSMRLFLIRWIGEDGLKFVRDILHLAPQYLAEDGILVVESGYY